VPRYRDYAAAFPELNPSTPPKLSAAGSATARPRC